MAEHRRTTLDRRRLVGHRRDETRKTPGERVPKRGRRPRDRGAVLVEAAIVLPFLAVLVFGGIDWGFTFNDYLTLSSAVRSGARIGTADVDPVAETVNADDDYQVLQAVNTALGGARSEVVLISIFNATSSTAASPPAGCSGISAATQAGLCDVYTAAEMNNDDQAQIETLSGAGSAWPPSTRPLLLSGGSEPAYLGVYVLANHQNITGIFGGSRLISETAVLRYEPPLSNQRNLGVGTTTTSTTTAPTTSTSTTQPTTSTTGGPTTTGSPATTQPPTTTTTKPPTTTTTTKPPATTTTTKAGGTTTTTKPPATTTTTKPPATTTTTKAPTTTTTKPPATTTTTQPPTTTTQPTTTTSTVPVTQPHRPPG